MHAVATLILTACYDGMPDAAEMVSSTTATTNPTSGTRGETANSAETTGSTTGSTVTTTTGPNASSTDQSEASTGHAEPIPWATDIDIDRIELNQGVGMDAALQGLPVAPSIRPQLVRERPLLVRVTWTLHEGFVPRPIFAELTIEDPRTGATGVYTSERMIEGPSNLQTLDGSFAFEVPAHDVAVDAMYAVSLLEVQGEGADMPTRLPNTGTIPLGVGPEPQTLDIELVPYRHILGACTRLPPTDAAMLETIEQHIYQQYPVRELVLHVHEPVDWTGSMVYFQPLLEHVSDLRVKEDPGGGAYWMAWLYPCDGPDDSYGGRAWVPTGATAHDAYHRAGVNRWYPDAPGVSLDILVHELGHAHGRLHVTCSGGEADPDPDYPHRGGLLGAWGYGVLDGSLRPPWDADIMTYCDPSWPSDYGWLRAFDRIRAIGELPDAHSSGAGGYPSLGSAPSMP